VLQVLKATSSSREKKMEKRRGIKMHPCLVPEVMLKAADMSSPSITWASMEGANYVHKLSGTVHFEQHGPETFPIYRIECFG